MMTHAEARSMSTVSLIAYYGKLQNRPHWKKVLFPRSTDISLIFIMMQGRASYLDDFAAKMWLHMREQEAKILDIKKVKLI